MLLIFVGHNFRDFAFQAKHRAGAKVNENAKINDETFNDYNAVICSHPVLSVMHAVVSAQPRVGQCYVSLILRGSSAARHSLLSHARGEGVCDEPERTSA